MNKQSKKLTAQQQADEQAASNRSILSMLYSNKSSHVSGNYGSNANNVSNSSLIMKILPMNTEPKELRLNQSVDDLLKKFATESKYKKNKLYMVFW